MTFVTKTGNHIPIEGKMLMRAVMTLEGTIGHEGVETLVDYLGGYGSANAAGGPATYTLAQVHEAISKILGVGASSILLGHLARILETD